MDNPFPQSRALADVTVGAVVESPGQARRTRLGLAPAVRQKLERLEAYAAAARGEIFRLAELIEHERQHRLELDRQYAMWEANYFARIDQTDVAALRGEQSQSDQEIGRLSALRDAAQTRWNGLGRVAERARAYLGLAA